MTSFLCFFKILKNLKILLRLLEEDLIPYFASILIALAISFFIANKIVFGAVLF